MLKLDVERAACLLVQGLRQEVLKTGFHRLVVGISGGVDSAVALILAIRALDSKNVLAVRMPYKTSSPDSLQDAQKLVEQCKVACLTIDITPQIDAYFTKFPDASPLRRGNKMARERMSVLYDLSMQEQALVLGTSNKTELLLGYGTQYGDLASAINPLGDLYKTQVYQLAKFLGVPEEIYNKPPSADLWMGQTDEAELGYPYSELDRLLYYMIDQRYDLSKLEALGFDQEMLSTIQARIRLNQYKRRLPIILKLSPRTVGVDFRYPRDWGV